MRRCDVCCTKQKINKQPCGCEKACDNCLTKYYNYAINNGNTEIRCMSCRVILKTNYMYYSVQKQRPIQECPGCKVLTEHIGGCDHMTCPICKQDWCWKCGNKMYNFDIDLICYNCSIEVAFLKIYWFILSTIVLIFMLMFVSEDSIMPLINYVSSNLIVHKFPWLIIEAASVLQTVVYTFCN